MNKKSIPSLKELLIEFFCLTRILTIESLKMSLLIKYELINI